MKKLAIALAMSLSVVSLAAISSADTLIMRDGTRVQGTVVGFAARTVTFRHADGVSRRYPTNQIDALEFDSAERASPRTASGGSVQAPPILPITREAKEPAGPASAQQTARNDRQLSPTASALPLIALLGVAAISVAFGLLVFGKLATAPATR